MNRQLKFRAWDKETNSWYEPDFRGYAGKIHELLITFSGELARRTMNPTLEHESLFPDKYILMQFTGLKDKNGTEIYEGDVVKSIHNFYYAFGPERGHTKESCDQGDLQIVWEGMGFVGVPISNKFIGHRLHIEKDCSNVEVIGNIYEHPHLLEATT